MDSGEADQEQLDGNYGPDGQRRVQEDDDVAVPAVPTKACQ